MKVSKTLLLRCSTSSILRSSSECREGTRNRSTFITDAVSAEALKNARPFEEIPGPKELPLIGNLHRYLPGIGEYSMVKWHEAQRLKFEKYGPIVREQILPGSNVVHIFDPKNMEIITRNEGKYPKRNFFLSMKAMREEQRDVYSTVGVAAGNGDEWYQLRSKVQKSMMKPQIMKMYLPQMNVIADDFIRRIQLLRKPDHQVPYLMNEFFKWALESVTYILFNKRLGCLADNLTTNSVPQKYIQAVNDFFLLTSKVELSLFPIWMIFPSLSPSYQKLKNVHDFFFQSAMEYVKNCIQDLGKKIEEEDNNLSLIEMLLQHCSPSDASVMAVDAMAAGIDTTSLTTAYVLLNLARNPHVQKKLQVEVDRVLPNGQPLTVQALNDMPYLRACVKESMRLCPTVQGTSRTLDKDIVLSGYKVPANTPMTLNYYVSSVQESNFPDAKKYIPERWLRTASGSSTTPDSFAFQPFGFGPRMCIGRRIADLEMFTLITKMMQNFWIENHCDDLEIRFQLVLMISSPLKYEFYDRHCP